eukprot:gnl/Trimastix_PCT/726.p2 GENE.gnl/Trimastix_PCT/726~~gnl/Trimastix_PCT/726.p2  ORF type:complete len:142 (+),score=44.68 gnl/Trimastix_PCT/726:446-871(+)
MSRFRLTEMNRGVFVKPTQRNLKDLKTVEQYVTYGPLTMKTVRDLLLRRAYVKAGQGNRVPLSNNKLVEDALGQHGIICVEDLVHEIHSIGPHFKQCQAILWPFILRKPRPGFKKPLVHFMDGGDHGNRGDAINDLVTSMI